MHARSALFVRSKFAREALCPDAAVCARPATLLSHRILCICLRCHSARPISVLSDLKHELYVKVCYVKDLR